MYNLRNLNDYEFEALSLDIMQKVLDTKLYRFPKGKDSGIDLCDEIENPKIIIQSKHYKDANSLKHDIEKKEQKKVENLNPENYYLCTSCELTKNKKLEIYNILKPYMKSANNIISGIDISDFIEKEENQDIVKKHYKLWLAASNVLSLVNNKKIFIDCDELVYDIEKNQYFLLKQMGI